MLDEAAPDNHTGGRLARHFTRATLTIPGSGIRRRQLLGMNLAAQLRMASLWATIGVRRLDNLAHLLDTRVMHRPQIR